MQFRSGDNRHEPLSDEAKSNGWKFILRHSYDPSLPAAFAPYVNFVAWLATSKGPNSWLVRGFVQFKNRRTYRIMKVRYSKRAEWIPVTATDIRIYNEFVVDPLPRNSVRYQIGVPLGQPNSILPNKLPVYGLNYSGPDLVEDYIAFHEAEYASYDAAANPVTAKNYTVYEPPIVRPSSPKYFYHDHDGSFYAAIVDNEIYLNEDDIPLRLNDDPLDDE